MSGQFIQRIVTPEGELLETLRASSAFSDRTLCVGRLNRLISNFSSLTRTR